MHYSCDQMVIIKKKKLIFICNYILCHKVSTLDHTKENTHHAIFIYYPPFIYFDHSSGIRNLYINTININTRRYY